MTATVYVQFSDSTESTIISYFAGPQPGSAFQNLGAVLSTDARWATFYSAMSSVKGMPAPGA